MLKELYVKLAQENEMDIEWLVYVGDRGVEALTITMKVDGRK